MQLAPQHNTLYQTYQEGKNDDTESALALSVRASSSPYIGDEDALYRNVEAFSVCLLKGARETLGD